MTEPFDAVLAEVYALPKASQCKALADRLAAAHSAEVAEARDWNERVSVCRDHTADIVDGDCVVCALAERDARIERLFAANEQVMARAEAAERNARELRAILYEAVGDDAKDWESGDGWPMGRFLVPALAGDYATAASEFAAYNAERAAIATTEDAHET